MPAITIGIMTHNYGRYIGEAIESVLVQEREDWELIISDDASTDHTREVVMPYLHDARIRYIRHEQNLGQAGNWDFLLKQGMAPVIGILHADDYWMPETLKSVLQEFEAEPETDLVFGNWCRLTEEGKKTQLVLNRTEALTGLQFYRNQVKQFTCLVSGAFLSRHVVGESGPPNLALKMVVDYEYFLRVAMYARRVSSLSHMLVSYRVHTQSTTNKCSKNGVFNSEMEYLPVICAERTKNFPAFHASLKILRQSMAKNIFLSGHAEIVQGIPIVGRQLMQRGLRLYPALIFQPKVLILYVFHHLRYCLLSLSLAKGARQDNELT